MLNLHVQATDTNTTNMAWERKSWKDPKSEASAATGTLKGPASEIAGGVLITWLL